MEDSIVTTGQRDESSPVHKGRKSEGRMIAAPLEDNDELVVRSPMS